MRTFVIRARKGTTRAEKIRSMVGGKQHLEVIAHCIINAFFISNDFRNDVEVYIVLDSAEDFPRTIKLSSNEGLSIAGFHENAVLDILEYALKNASDLKKDEMRDISPGIKIIGYGFEKLMSNLLEHRAIYLLEPKGKNIRDAGIDSNPVFVLSDHIPLPKNIIKSFKRRGLQSISLGKKMLFASQVVTILHYEMDS